MKKSREGEGMNKTTERKLSECNYCKSDDSIQDMASQNQTAPKTASNNTTAQKTASASQNQTIQKSLNQVSRKTVSQNQRTTASQNKSAHATGSQNKTAQKPALQRPKQTNSTRTVKSEDNEQAQEHDPDRLMIDFGLFEDEMNLQDSVDDPEPSPDIEVSIVKRGPSRGSAGSVMTQSSSRGKGPTSGQGSKKGQDRMQTSPYTRSSNSQEVKRKSLTMSANVKGTGYRKVGIFCVYNS